MNAYSFFLHLHSGFRYLVLLLLLLAIIRAWADWLGKKAGSLSGGQQRLVEFARCLMLDPELIMYDEPFAGLDPISLGITANLIRTLNQALGATSILVTHDVPESFAIADYVYFLANGGDRVSGSLDQCRELLVRHLQALSHNPDLNAVVQIKLVAPGTILAAAHFRKINSRNSLNRG